MMNISEYNNLYCEADVPIIDAMKKINLNSCGTIYILDNSNHLVGSLTDGDIRRWIIKGGNLNDHVKTIMNVNPIHVTVDNKGEAVQIMLVHHIRSIAVTSDDNELVDILFLFSEKTKPNNDLQINNPVIIMAGGKGTRLYPYTKILPKPLIPIGEVPIIERIMGLFSKYGVSEFYLTVNYRKEMIKSYFTEIDKDYTIHYVEEDKPLGTAGSIRLIGQRFDKPIIITNCDILIDADYAGILRHHCDICNDLTIVSSLKSTVIPYGVLHTEEKGIVKEIVEKPQLSHFVNTGMYIMNPEYIEWIPQKEVYHMTELAEKMIQNGKQVGMYPISENSFLDMGEFAEMKRMEEKINAGFAEYP